MKHLDEFLNEAEGENNWRSIVSDMSEVSNNSKLTNEIAVMMAKALSKEEFQKFKLWLNHAKNQQHIKISNAKKSGNRFGFH